VYTVSCGSVGYKRISPSKLPIPEENFKVFTPNASVPFHPKYNTEIVENYGYTHQCSGHGRCRTIAEAGLEFNALLD